jgi:hypothetical protein
MAAAFTGGSEHHAENRSLTLIGGRDFQYSKEASPWSIFIGCRAA